MTKIMCCVVLLGVISLSACSGPEYKEVDCTIRYKRYIFPFDSEVRLKVNAVKYDRFGRMSVKVVRGQGIDFYYPWISSDNFINEDCG